MSSLIGQQLVNQKLKRETLCSLSTILVPLILLNQSLPLRANPATIDDQRLSIGAGIFDAYQGGYAAVGAVSYEASPCSRWWDIRPAAQLMSVSGGGYYVGVGLLKSFSISRDFQWALSFSAGAAHESNESVGLNYDIEFLSRAILDYRLHRQHFLRLEVGHISNGGLDKRNPGTEPVLLYWQLRF